ncbi:MAG: tRNA pseudouridine(38-40) synthase TruA [Chloroflexaceae bacterium]|nr:tRNA pseudouridine(38-40) synthase TruA [Chloroflexaceae bacterium]
MRNIAMRVAYDGTHFVGSQWQSQGRSVQGVLESTWNTFTREQKRFTFAGRTDAGVHAYAQVANVYTASDYPVATVQRACNALLPADVAVYAVQEVADDFHARHSAVQRRYRYLIDDTPVAQPLLRHAVLHVPWPLDLAAMQAAMDMLPGEHDFVGFARAMKSTSSTTRICYEARCYRIRVLEQTLIAVELVANAFLYAMVRTVVGTLLQVGSGQRDPSDIAAVLISKDRRQAGPTAPPHGLTLVDVVYPPDILAATESRTQRLRIGNEDIFTESRRDTA